MANDISPSKAGASDPFRQLQDRIDHVFHDFARGAGWLDFPKVFGPVADNIELNPSLEMHDADGKVTVTVELPGVDEKDINVSVDDDTLTVSGEKRSSVERKDGDVFRSERTYGRFSRLVMLPFTIDADKVDARFDKGVLTLTLAKPANAAPKARRIEIRH